MLGRRSIDGLVVAVTGAASGIGLEVARALVAQGARVALGDLDAVATEAAAAALGPSAIGVRLDVSSPESFAAFLDHAESLLGPIDVLVNNAGVMWVGPFADEPLAAQRRQIEVNLLGVIRGTQLAATRMLARGAGHIVTVASAASKLAPPGEATYAATKHGVFGYLDAARAELRGSGVRVSVVMPGVVDTALAGGTASGAIRRLRPAEVARAVVGVIRRPRFAVVVPARIAVLHKASAVLPEQIRTPMLRRALPDQVAAVRGTQSRAPYESRYLTDHPSPENPRP